MFRRALPVDGPGGVSAGRATVAARDAETGSRAFADWLKSTLALVAFLAVLALIWQALARFAGFDALLFPPLGVLLERMSELVSSGELARETLATLGRMVVAFGVAIVIAVPLGLAMGRSPLMQDLFGPVINLLLPIPVLVLVPLFVLWLGLTLKTAVLLIALASALPIAVNAASGSQRIEPQLLRVAEAMNVRGPSLLVKVILPAAMPSILIGLRQGLAMAWRAAIGAEFFSVAPTGLGARMFQAKDYVQMDVILCLLLVIMIISMFIDKLVFAPLEAHTIRRWGVGER
jgi:ABC-type nitrate/sulfonate/bicarbonate transport system permease component